MFRNRNLKISITAILATIILVGAFTAPAAAQSSEQLQLLTKDETVYATLDNSGKPTSVEVVSHIDVPESGVYVDYAKLNNIAAISQDATPEIDGERIKWQLTSDPSGFYYSGTAVGALPFLFDITFSLDGQKVDTLLGRTGKATIKIKVDSNADTNPYYYENLMCQLQVTLDLSRCQNIVAGGASGTLVGSKRVYSLMVLPKKSSELTLTLDCENFEMDAISATCIPFSVSEVLDIGTEIDDLKDGTDKMYDASVELKDGVVEMVDGVDKIVDGGNSLYSGTSKYVNGVNSYLGGVSSAAGGFGSIKGGLDALAANGAQISSGYSALEGGVNSYFDGVIAALNGVPGYESLVAGAQALKPQVSGFGGGLDQFTGGVSEAADGAAQYQNGLSLLQEQIVALKSGGLSLVSGVRKMRNGLDEFSEKTGDLPDNAQKFVDAAVELKDGVATATQQLTDFSKKSENNTPVSFSRSDMPVRSVQFIIRAAEMRPKRETLTNTEVVVKKSLLEKFLDLFR